MKSVLFLLCFLFSGCTSWQNHPPLQGEIFDKIEGRWDKHDNPEFCQGGSNIQEIEFSRNNRIALFNRPIPPKDENGNYVNSYTYHIMFNDESTITMYISDEERTTEDGDRFVWVLHLVDDDTFRWRATHWPKGYRTILILKRCPSEEP